MPESGCSSVAVHNDIHDRLNRHAPADYDLAESKRRVRELYPVLVDAHGNIVDGFHRLEADPGWERRTLEHIRTPAQLWLARVVANTHRRAVSREERVEQVTSLAEALVDEGVPRAKVVSAIAELTTFSERYIRGLLPDEYKMMSKARFAEPSSADEDEDPIPADTAPRPHDFADHGATATEDEPPRGRDGEEGVASDAEVSSEEAVPRTPEEHVDSYLSGHLKPDLGYLAWDVARRFRLGEAEARRLIGEVQSGGWKPPRPETRGMVEEGIETPRAVACPLCGRGGADLDLILSEMEELRAIDPGLSAYRWIEESLER